MISREMKPRSVHPTSRGIAESRTVLVHWVIKWICCIYTYIFLGISNYLTIYIVYVYRYMSQIFWTSNQSNACHQTSNDWASHVGPLPRKVTDVYFVMSAEEDEVRDPGNAPVGSDFNIHWVSNIAYLCLLKFSLFMLIYIR